MTPEKAEGEGEVLVSTTVNRTMTVAVALAVAVALFAAWLYRNSILQVGLQCSILNFYVHGTINLVLHVALFSLFVCIFFFTVVHMVEKRTVYLNLKRVMNEILDQIETLTDKPLNLSAFVGSIQAMSNTKEMNEADDDVKRKNRALQQKAFHMFGGILGLGLIVSFLLWGCMYAYARKKKGAQARAGCDYPHMGHILKHNVVILFFVFITELFFLYGVTMHYNSLDDNYVKYLVVQKLLNHIPVTTPKHGVRALGKDLADQTRRLQF